MRAHALSICPRDGMRMPIDDWVLREACRRNEAWQDAGLPPMAASSNASARQFEGEEPDQSRRLRAEGYRVGGQLS